MNDRLFIHTKYLHVLDVLHVQPGGVRLRVVLASQHFTNLVVQSLGRLLVFEQMAEGPEGQSEGVVVDMQVDQIVALDVGLSLLVMLHEFYGTSKVAGQVRSSQQLAGVGTAHQLGQSGHGLREQLDGESQPQVIEVPTNNINAK